MPEEFNWLLTDEFIAFSEKIKEIHEAKKSKKEQLKAFYEKIQAEIKLLDEEAKDAEEKLQSWKKSKENSEE